MKKIYLILCFAAAIIAPECCAMKRVPNIIKKCIQSKNYNILDKHENAIKQKPSFVKKWNEGVALLVCGSLIPLFISSNSILSYSSAQDGDFLLGSVPMTMLGEIAVNVCKGPVLIYTAFQVACFYQGYRDAKKELEK